MKVALHKYFLSLFVGDEELEDDKGDIEYARMVKSENVPYEPLRDVLAEIEAEKCGSIIHRPTASASEERPSETAQRRTSRY